MPRGELEHHSPPGAAGSSFGKGILLPMITTRAYAKINLTLEVLGRRDDGYHEIASILQTVSLYDTLTFEEAEAISFDCDRPGLAARDNLVVRAAHLLREAAGVSRGAAITLAKRIPVSAGLGGGSADAGATLLSLNRLWGLELSREDLLPIAARIGSDVPFFLYGGTARVSGRGERVEPLPSADLEWAVVLTPRIDVPGKTALMFSKIGPMSYTSGGLTRKLAARLLGKGDMPPQFLFNAFDEVARAAIPNLGTYWDAFHALGAREIHLCGAGLSLFAPVSTKHHATAMQLLLEHRHGWEAHTVSMVDREMPSSS